MRGRFHFVRRPIKPRWLDTLVNWHFRDAGFGIVAKRGGLDAIVERLERGDIVVFPFDQYAKGRTAFRWNSSATWRARSRASR